MKQAATVAVWLLVAVAPFCPGLQRRRHMVRRNHYSPTNKGLEWRQSVENTDTLYSPQMVVTIYNKMHN